MYHTGTGLRATFLLDVPPAIETVGVLAAMIHLRASGLPSGMYILLLEQLGGSDS